MEKASWKTFGSGADEEGFFDPAQELFGRANKGLIDSVVREGGQNTVDNGNKKSKKPIELYFKRSDVKVVDFPNGEEVIDILKMCKNYNIEELKLDNDNPAVVFCDKSLDLLNNKKGVIPFLEIGDSNTTGILGDDQDRTKGWFRMCQSIGVSVGAGTGGGSRGMGKKAPLLVSEMKTLFISTMTDEGVAFKGIGQFTSHIDSDRKVYSAKSKFELEEKKSIRKESDIPKIFKRTEVGSSIFIAGFTIDDWEGQFIVAVLDNFYAAIYHGKLNVHVGDFYITKKTIKKFVEDYAGEQTKMFFRCISEAVPIEKVLDDVGMVKLYVLLDETFKHPKRIDYMRDKRMKIFDMKRGWYIRDNFAAVFICDGEEGSKRLRLMEGAEHTDWKPRYDNKKSDKDYKDKIDNWIYKEIKKLETEIEGDSSFVSGMEKKLPMVDDGSGASRAKGTSETVHKETSREKIDESDEEMIIPESSEGAIYYIDPLSDGGIGVGKPHKPITPRDKPVAPPKICPVCQVSPCVCEKTDPKQKPKKIRLSDFNVTIIKNDKAMNEYHLFIESSLKRSVILNINISPASEAGKIDDLKVLQSANYDSGAKIRIAGGEDKLLNVKIDPSVNKYIIYTKYDDKYAFNIEGNES